MVGRAYGSGVSLHLAVADIGHSGQSAIFRVRNRLQIRHSTMAARRSSTTSLFRVWQRRLKSAATYAPCLRRQFRMLRHYFAKCLANRKASILAPLFSVYLFARREQLLLRPWALAIFVVVTLDDCQR